MGVEIQNNIINTMILDTANRIRLISGTLVPLMTQDGHPFEICQFNDYTNEIANMLESQIKFDTKSPFTAPVSINYYINQFLNNLSSFLSSVYDENCEECPDRENCNEYITKDNDKRKSPKVISMNKSRNIPNIINKKIVSDEEIIDLISMYLERYYPDEFHSPEVQTALEKAKTNFKVIYNNDKLYDVNKMKQYMIQILDIISALEIAFKRDHDDDEFL